MTDKQKFIIFYNLFLTFSASSCLVIDLSHMDYHLMLIAL